MKNDPAFVDFVLEQMEDAGTITCRAMFGGHTVYCEGKVVALICDNQLFVKPTEAGRGYIGKVVEAPAYEGARNSFLVSEQMEDREWLSGLIRVTEKELPLPGKKKKRSR